MQRIFFALFLAVAVGVPLGVGAQPAPGPDGAGPPPEMRAKMGALHAQAKTDAYAALSADHRTQVQAIAAQVASGSLMRRDAARQIDALLTPDETKSVLGVAQKSRDAMRAAFAGSGMPADRMHAGSAPANAGTPPSGGTPPSYAVPGSSAPAGAGPGAGAPGGGPGPRRNAMSAGRFLLMVSMTPDQMRALRANRPSPSP